MNSPTVARVLASLRALALGGLLLTGCSAAVPDAPLPAATAPRDTAVLSASAMTAAGFTMDTIAMRPWRDVWSVPARITLDAAVTQTIGSIVEGRIKDMLVRPGDEVQAGQVLVTIHSHEMTDARSNLSKAIAASVEADAAAQLTATEAARAERLFTARALSQAELERARTAAVSTDAMRSSAVAEVTRSRAMVEHLVGDGRIPSGIDPHDVLIRAATAGTVVSRTAQAGTVVLIGAPLLTVSRITMLMLVAQLPERAIGAATKGALVRFRVAAYPERDFTARVVRVAPALDTLTRTIEIAATIADGAELLKPEMFATAELQGTASAPTLTVAAAAVQAMDGDTVLVTASPQGAAFGLEAVKVRIGRRTTQSAEVLDGLPAGTVIISGRASIAKAEILKRREAGN